MSAPVFLKDPNERLDYDADFARWLPDSDTLSSATATISGGTAIIDAVEPTSTTVRVWVSGGAAGETNLITIRATTAGGRIKETAIRIKIRDTA